MDRPQEVGKKLEHLRTYVPFLERMIGKLEVRTQQVGTSHGQLERLHGLHSFLTKPLPRAPRMEMLEKMEAVIRSIQEKVQKAQGKQGAESGPMPEPNHPLAVPRSEPRVPRLEGHHPPGSILSRLGPPLDRMSGQTAPGQSPIGHGSSTSKLHQSSRDWQQSRREHEEKEADSGHTERSRDGGYRPRDFGDLRHALRSRERDRERSRERDHDRNRLREYDRRRENDRPREAEGGSDRDWRMRHSSDSERQRDRAGNPQERGSDRGRERDFHRSYSDHDRRSDGRGFAEHEGKLSSKRNSLLDLPMPPSGAGQEVPHNKDRFQSSREKLQRLFGISGDSVTKPVERDIGQGTQGRSWRDETRARGNIFTKNAHSERHEMSEDQYPRSSRPSQNQDSHQWGPSYSGMSHSFPHNQSRGMADTWRSGSSHQDSFHRDPRQQSVVHSQPPDTPMSPDQSPNSGYVMDTPESPDADASFSPVNSSEEGSPVKQIPLENDKQRQKGVDMEAIKKALARIRATESSREATQKSEQSYRYEDFVGPAAMDEDAPYDPEEVWNSQEMQSTSTQPTIPPTQKDRDPRLTSGSSTGPPSQQDRDPRLIPNTSSGPSQLDKDPRLTSSSSTGPPSQQDRDPRLTSSGSAGSPNQQDRDPRLASSSSLSLPQSHSHHSIPHIPHGRDVPHPHGSPHSSLPPHQRQSGMEDKPNSNFPMNKLSVRAASPSWQPQSSPHSRVGFAGREGVDMDMRRQQHVTPQSKPPVPSVVNKQQQHPSPKVPEALLKPPQSSVPNKPPDDPSDKAKYPISRLEGIKSRIAHQANELIRPGQQGVAASQMEKYRLKKQGSMSESKTSVQGKPDLNKNKEPVSVLDILLPESKSDKGGSEDVRSPGMSPSSAPPRDPRLKQQDNSVVQNRDPRIGAPSGSMASRDPRQQRNLDLRKDAPFSSGLQKEGRDEPGRFYGPQGIGNRDPPGKFPQNRDPRSSSRDSRQESVVAPRDPRMAPRADRHMGGMWPQQQQQQQPPPPPVSSQSNYPVQSHTPVMVDSNPGISASGSLIGKSFTCLMMRGLPGFTNSNHIYGFFQEYMLRDMCIELDQHYQCKGTAYVHFPSHASAQEALELLNGRHFVGSPVELRICAVGILRQAKIAYDQMNRDRESKQGIPLRPRGNFNPFYKPRPREPPSSTTPSRSQHNAPDKTLETAGKTSEPSQVEKSSKYTELCGVKLQAKQTSGMSSFKIPKIKKDTPVQKELVKSDSKKAEVPEKKSSKNEATANKRDSKKSEPVTSKKDQTSSHGREKKGVSSSDVEVIRKEAKEASSSEECKRSDADGKKNEAEVGKKSNAKVVSKDTSESEDDMATPKPSSKKVRKFKKIVIASDSDSEGEEVSKESPGKKNNEFKSVSPVCKEPEDLVAGGEDDDNDDSDDEGSMVIDESVTSETNETEGSEASSHMSEDQALLTKDKVSKGKQIKKKGKSGSGKAKGSNKVVKSKAKAQTKSGTASRKNRSGKKDRYVSDSGYRAELGLKLTRHTQGELEELIKEQNKLKVLIPVPQKIMVSIWQDERSKRRQSGRQKTPEPPPTENIVAIGAKKAKETPKPKSPEPPLEANDDDTISSIPVIQPLEGYWEYNAKVGKFYEAYFPENTKLICGLKREVAVGSPTSRRGKKRKKSNLPRRTHRKKSKVSAKDTVSESHSTGDTGKRALESPIGREEKKMRLAETRGKDTEQFNLFDDSLSESEDLPDLTQITPSLFDVDPTISNALPDATVLANVLSPPPASQQGQESIINQVVEENQTIMSVEETKPTKSSEVDKPLDKEGLKVLDEVIDLVNESGNESKNAAADSVKAETNEVKSDETKKTAEETSHEEVKPKIVKDGKTEEGSQSCEAMIDMTEKESQSSDSVLDKIETPAEDKPQAAVEETASKSEDSSSTFLKESKPQEPQNTEELDPEVENQTSPVKVKEDTSVSEMKPVSDVNFSESLRLKKTEDEEVPVTRMSEISSGKTETPGLPIAKDSDANSSLKLDKSTSDTSVLEDDGDADETASVGKISTSSFVDDASVVSSEGRDLKTPESQMSRKGKKSKQSASLPPVECRRVTRGSIVQPLTAEVVEWDDGGVVDLFQCDLCDYVGRHIASHLVNFHSERELPCEFKKEDFTPVIKDHVGPPANPAMDCPPLNLRWIPENMNFEKSVTCKDCDYISNSRFDLVYHYLEHQPKSAYQVNHCRLCNYMSERKEDFYNHMSSHTGEYRYKCNLCGHRAFKFSLMKLHHKECHASQRESIITSPMQEEGGHLYIYVCKLCMFVRISQKTTDMHVQQKHGGKADIHKANMSRHIVLHSELRKCGGGDSVDTTSSQALRTKIKGRKKRKGKKFPDLEVFGVEEEEDVNKEEEEAKQLVDRISFNIHTTMSVQDAQKRMSLLNSISKKLDEETEEKNEEGELIDTAGENTEEKDKTIDKKEEKDEKKESEKVAVDSATKNKVEGERQSLTTNETADEESNSDAGKGSNSSNKERSCDDSSSVETDNESTMSAFHPDAFEDDLVMSGKSSLQETIRKLSAKLEEDTQRPLLGDRGKKVVCGEKVNQKNGKTAKGWSVSSEKTVKQVENEKRKAGGKEPEKGESERDIEVTCSKSGSVNDDDDSDSDNLVICEDEGEGGVTAQEGSQSAVTDVSSSPQSSLQDSIHSILRETVATPSSQSAAEKLPKLRIRPAHQLMPVHSWKGGKKQALVTVFKCCVVDCYFSSTSNTDLIQHIIAAHGPYKCIASGCQFVTKSRDLFAMHLIKLHPNLNFLVCPFHCKTVFRHFADLIDHLTDHHAETPSEPEPLVEEPESDAPGFLRIESVSTMDPTTALQMFGDDYHGGSSSSPSTSVEAQSPVMPAISSQQGITITSPVSIRFGNTVLPATVTSRPAENQVTLSLPEPSNMDDTIQVSQSISPQISGTSPYHTSLSGTSSIQTTHSTPLQISGASLFHTSTSGVLSSGTSPSSEIPSLPGTPDTAAASSSQSTSDTFDDDDDRSSSMKSKGHPPGMATVPKTPPTVPIQHLFLKFQTADAFTTLTRKLAPEVFKCMHRGCIFADDDPDTFLSHLMQHPGTNYRCCYCLMLRSTPDHLVQHVLTEHSHCQFQCKYCLYRAFTKIYMGVHLRNFHPNDEPRYIKVETISQHHPPNPAIDQFVRPYRCTYQECQYRTVDAEAFKSHVNTHGAFVILSCDFCHKHLHVLPLIQHMREHQMNEYQCPYCLHGESEKEHLLSHLLNCHPGRPGKVLLRKQITAAAAAASSSVSDGDASADSGLRLKSLTARSNRKTDEGGKPNTSHAPGKEGLQVSTAQNLEGRRISRSLSRELDTKVQAAKKAGEEDSSSNQQQVGEEDRAEKTGLSGHALYRCGNEGCEYSSASQIPLREHLQVCHLAKDSTVVRCHHCGKQCRHLSTLFDHLKVHGPKRYHCGVTGCDYRATMLHYFKNHMKQIHRCTGFKQLIKDFKNREPETQEYVVYPKDATHLMREGHRKRKNEYAIEDIHRIPRAHVSYSDMKCYYCSFVSKVRLNLIKHIRLHEKYPEGIPHRLHKTAGTSSPIPIKQPVNPVPCLERKELMFDKMMNLAGSSFEYKKKTEDTDLRTKHPIPPEEYQKLPKFVPEEKLYTCGIDGCNYLSCDDMMLKYHIRTLHAHATTFPCPHCVNVHITVEKMSPHFKLHGERLYRCGWCPYISYRRNVVDRHMKEKHRPKKMFDFVIREPEDPDAPKKVDEMPAEEPSPAPPPPVPQEPQWQCGLCKFSSVTQQEMVNHTSLKHDIKSQFKCGYCTVRSSVRTSFDAHFAAKHPSQPFRVLCMYYRLDSEDIEPIPHGEDQHTHEPLWKRNDPERIRHIRGILIDDDPEMKKNWLKRTGTGKPDKGEFVCPRCGSFKTACVATFRSHLCREADYDRYQCVECGVSNALLPNLQRHFTKIHQSPFTADSYLNLPVEEDKEAWVESVIKHQQDLIRKWQEKGGGGTGVGSGGSMLEQVDPLSPSPQQQVAPSPSKSPASTSSRRSSTASVSSSAQGESESGLVLHDSGSERRFICDTCGSECRSAAGLKSHTTAMHQARFKCHYCPFASNSEDAVKQHSSVKHPRLQSEVLDVSQRCRVQKGDENMTVDVVDEDDDVNIEYRNIQTGLKKIQGSEEVKSELKTEIKAEGELGEMIENVEHGDLQVGKTYSCQFCPFTTSTSSGLNNHKRNKHADTRLFMCMYCHGRFNTNFDALRHHKWKHQNLKPDITHLQYQKPGDEMLKHEIDGSFIGSDLSPEKLDPLATSNVPPCPRLDLKLGKSKARKSFTKSVPVAPVPIGLKSTSNVQKNESETTYSCCHCSHKSRKLTIEEHMKKQHRDLPYQVRREEMEKVFKEVYTYNCIHCVVESISLAQAMDHWLQNHALLDFKYNLALKHSGEVSNQVVSSTTVDKDLPQSTMEDDSFVADTSVSSTDASPAVASSLIISSSSETSSVRPLPVSRRRGSIKDLTSPRSSMDLDDDDDVDEAMEGKDTTFIKPLSSIADPEDVVYKCSLCKKSSAKLEDLEAHVNKIHPDRKVPIKKLPREMFEDLYRQEYECGHCGLRGRHKPIHRHHKANHPTLPLNISRVAPPPRQNIYFRCEVCWHVVKNLSSVRQHIRRQHPEADEFTFTRLALGSPMRPPIKQPFKCDYCGDVGETLEEMHNHHTFLHSHLKHSITNLMDEALSSLHSPSSSHATEVRSQAPLSLPPPSIPTASEAESSSFDLHATTVPVPEVPRLKNTARKSFPRSKKPGVALKSTSRPPPLVTSDSEDGFSVYRVPQPPLKLDHIYAFVNMGGGVPVRLTVQQLSGLVNLTPHVELTRVNSDTKIS